MKAMRTFFRRFRQWLEFGALIALLAFGALALPAAAAAQSTSASAVAHGINVSWTAPAVPAGGNPIAGYEVFRCFGACTAATPICAAPPTQPCWTVTTPAPISATSWLDPASDTALVAGGTYTFGAETFDTTGANSALSNVSTVEVPSTGFPVTVAPNAPTGVTPKVQ